MRIQQVRSTVQRNGRLAGTGTALHNQHAGDFGTDDAVLLRLDGGDDVGHATGALGAQRGKQRTLALQLGLLIGQQRSVENLVFDANDSAALGRQVPAGAGSERSRRGGLVERARLRHTPVQQDGLLVGIPQPDASDIAVDASEQFETPEGEAVFDLAELRDAVLVEARERVPFGARLVRAADGTSLHVFELLACLIAQGVEPRVETPNVVAFAFDLG